MMASPECIQAEHPQGQPFLYLNPYAGLRDAVSLIKPKFLEDQNLGISNWIDLGWGCLTESWIRRPYWGEEHDFSSEAH